MASPPSTLSAGGARPPCSLSAPSKSWRWSSCFSKTAASLALRWRTSSPRLGSRSESKTAPAPFSWTAQRPAWRPAQSPAQPAARSHHLSKNLNFQSIFNLSVCDYSSFTIWFELTLSSIIYPLKHDSSVFTTASTCCNSSSFCWSYFSETHLISLKLLKVFKY